MSKQHSSQASEIRPLDKLSKELGLSARWDMPAIFLAVYENAIAGAKALSDLEARLTWQGQSVTHITPDFDGKNNIIDEITRNNHWDETVFFIMHLGRCTDKNIYATLNTHSEFFINNHIRVVYWLTKPDLIAYVQDSPDYCFFQHKLIEFSSTSGWEHVLPRIAIHNSINPSDKEEYKTIEGEEPSLSQLLSADIRDDLDGVIERSYLLIKLGIFYFRQKDYPRALQYLAKALEVAEITENEQFLLASQTAFALVQAELERYDDAVLIQKKITKIIPETSDVWNNLASLYSTLFMFDESISAYKTALSISHGNPVSWQGLGEVYLHHGQLAKSIEALQKAVLVAPNFGYAWKGLGKAYTAAGNNPKAVECYTKSLEIDFRQADIWFEVGCISEDDAAQSALQYALALDQTLADAWNLLGNIYYRSEKFNKAINSYYKAIQLNKDFGWPYANMALIYTQQKKYKNAILLYIKSVDIFQDDQEKANVLHKLGSTYRDSGKYGSAVSAYREAGKLSKKGNLFDKNLLVPGPFRYLSSTPTDNDNTPQKNNDESKSAEETQSSSPVPIVAATQLRKVNKSALLRKVLKKNKKAGKVDYWLELGTFYVRKRMYELAEDAFLIAIELDPHNGWPYYNLALANTVNGLYRNAVPLYEKSIRLFDQGKDKALSWNQLGNVYRRLNEPSLAVAAFENARVLDPKKSPILSRARLSLMSNCYAK